MIRTLFLILLFVISDLFGQEINSPIFIEHNSVILDSSQAEIICYRIPYNNLLFVKNAIWALVEIFKIPSSSTFSKIKQQINNHQKYMKFFL